MNKEEYLKELDEFIDSALRMKKLVEKVFESSEEDLSMSLYCFSKQIYFSFSAQADFKRIRHMTRKWDKELDSEGELRYRTKIDGIELICHVAEAPPSCRFVIETVEVAERIVPAHTKTVKRLICNEETERKETPNAIS